MHFSTDTYPTDGKHVTCKFRYLSDVLRAIFFSITDKGWARTGKDGDVRIDHTRPAVYVLPPYGNSRGLSAWVMGESKPSQSLPERSWSVHSDRRRHNCPKDCRIMCQNSVGSTVQYSVVDGLRLWWVNNGDGEKQWNNKWRSAHERTLDCIPRGHYLLSLAGVCRDEIIALRTATAASCTPCVPYTVLYLP